MTFHMILLSLNIVIYAIRVCRSFVIIIIIFFPRKNEGGKKLRKVERGLKLKTSPGGSQRENRRAAIRR